MTLIDYFKLFQVVSGRKRLSANAHSLYYAILGEFNEARYPEELYLRNGNLQDRSSINSGSSFDAARNALINAKLITHKKNYYSLLYEEAMEKLCKSRGKVMEKAMVDITHELKENKDKEGEKTTTTAAAGASTCTDESLGSEAAGCNGASSGAVESEQECKGDVKGTGGRFCGTGHGYGTGAGRGAGNGNGKREVTGFYSNVTGAIGVPSDAVMAAWRKGDGCPLNFYQQQKLALIERERGTRELVRVIEAASLKDVRAGLTLQYLEAFLKDDAEPEAEVAGYGGEDEFA